ncbi:hypothetical protein MPSEU_000072200 [Mayamaea pseudoterrestris]|nr:hypothetical protein MPSEU_000072200 [Mayamaea pseudoterrestris]
MDQPRVLRSEPVLTAQKLVAERESSVTETSSATMASSNGSKIMASEQLQNSVPAKTSLTTKEQKAETMSTLKEDESTKIDQTITTGLKLPLKRLMERLRIHRTDARLQELVHDLIMNKIDSKSPPLVLMTGPRGCGTSHVIRMSLQDALNEQGGYFLQGKCHVHHNDLPYPALVGAFTEFVHVVMRRNLQEEMKGIILNALSSAQVLVLVDMIPALSKILGGDVLQNVDNEIDFDKCGQRHPRFVFAFGGLIQAICKSGRPIVLFLQDLNLCDASSLDYYSLLATDPRYSGLILIGSCNSGVSGTSYLSCKLRQIEDQLQKPIVNLDVNNLQYEEVQSMIARAIELDLEKDSEKVVSISKLVYEHTAGNLLLITSLIRWLVHAQLLQFDVVSGAWTWDEVDIRHSIDPTMTVDDYVKLELGQLTEAASEVLQVAACLGPDLYPSLMTKVLSVEQFDQGIQEGSRRGLLAHSKITDRYSFAHETVRVASYQLIDMEAREQLHLKIGRRIFRALNSDEMERAIFLVLSQLKLCQNLIREDERVDVAKLCLHAGSKAARSSANTTSLAFLEMGLNLLGPRRWRDEYDLTLLLSSALAEIHMCTASFRRMDEILSDVFANTRTLHDRLPAYSTRICGLAATERSPEALQVGKEALRLLREPLPKRPSIPILLIEVYSILRLLRSKSDEQLLRLPPATETEKIACMQLLHLIFLDASICDPLYCPFIAVKLMRLTIKHGFSAFTAAAFVYFGVTILSRDQHTGLRCGELSLKFLHRFGAKEFKPRVYFLYYGVTAHWSKPMTECVTPLIDAFQIGKFTGDIVAAGLCANAYALTCLEAGEKLTILEPKIMWLINELTARHQQHAVLSLLLTAQNLHHYLGLSDDPLCVQGDLLNHDDAHSAALARGNFMNALIVPFTRMIVAFMFEEFALASSLVEPYLKYLWNVPVNTGVVTTIFFVAMMKISSARMGLKQRKSRRFAIHVLKRIEKYAPTSALDKVYLLKAELCSLRGDNSRALRYYRCSHALAHQDGFVYMRALVNEIFARHLYRVGDVEMALPYFRAACDNYNSWGALAKARQLETKIVGYYPKSA